MTMNLSGSLEAFGLGDVLTLLGMGGRTARMQVTSAAGVGAVHLVDGHVSAASADLARAGLLRQVVAAGAVPATDLALALEHAEPVPALVDAGVVSRDVAHRVAVEHIVDALGEMLGWTDGEFAVWSGDADPADIGVRLPVGEALERGRSREQEWAQVREALPEAGSVLALVPDVADALSLGVEDWSVLARVDGRRTLSEVLGATGIAPLVASDRLVQLMGRGLVRVRRDDVAAPDEAAALIAAFESGPPTPEPVVPVVVSDLLVEPEVDVLTATPDLVVAPVGEEAAEMAAGVVDDVAAEPPVEPDPGPVVVPALAEPVEVADAQPWDLPRPPVIEPDPAVAAWVESAAPADELAALLGHSALGDAPLGVEPREEAPAENLVPAREENLWAGGVEAAADGDVAAEAAAAQGIVDSFGVPVAEFLDDWVPAVEVAPEPVFTFPVQVEASGWAPANVEPADPVAAEVPVAPGVEWSPWAQALGLGAPAPEGELVVDPLAGPGIAKMIADAHGLAETSEVPVPQVPVMPATGGAEQGARDPLAGAAVVSERPVVPLPREPEAQTRLAEAVEPADTAIAEETLLAAGAEEAAGDDHPIEVAPAAPSTDPLTGGLLSQLMSGVRGL